MLNLNTISLVAVGSTRIEETRKAINICTNTCKFDNILYLTEKQNHEKDKGINYIDIDRINSKYDYQQFVVLNLPDILLNFNSSHFLIINWDGFIINTGAWTNEFYTYDYIGAPWPWLNNVCGNGGFCLKSKKFLNWQKQIFKDIDKVNEPEDLVLSYYYRDEFQKLGCKYAPGKIGYRFSTEHGGYINYNSFGFHDFTYNPQFRYLIQ